MYFTYQLYTISDDQLNNSNYVILPENILKDLEDEEVPYHFKITTFEGLYTWVGVKEFTAAENTIMIPEWIIKNLEITDSSIITLTFDKNIKKGKRISLQPLTKNFFELNDIDVILENILSNYFLLHNNLVLNLNIIDINYQILIKNVELDWEQIDLEKISQLNDEAINIKDINLEVDIINTFLEEENLPYCDSTDNESTDDEIEIPKLSNEELREARLKYFSNRF